MAIKRRFFRPLEESGLLAFYCCLLLLVSLVFAAKVSAEPLSISYLERPPYYYRDAHGKGAGLLIERTRDILREAEISAQFVILQPSQIMFLLQRATVPHCSVGWFKTAERELFAKFSRPIYQDQPLVLLAHREKGAEFPVGATLRQVFSDPHLTIARLGQFSYGEVVDRLLAELSPASLFRTTEQVQLLQALHDRSADYMLIAPEEIEMLISSSGLAETEFISVPLAGMPAGNLRYLICGQGVSDEVMTRLDAAISKLYPGQGEAAR